MAKQPADRIHVHSQLLESDERFSNNPKLLLLIYKEALDSPGTEATGEFERLFAEDGYFGREVKYTKRHRLGQRLSQVSHLASLHGAKAEVTLDIEVKIPEGVPDSVVRTVTEKLPNADV